MHERKMVILEKPVTGNIWRNFQKDTGMLSYLSCKNPSLLNLFKIQPMIWLGWIGDGEPERNDMVQYIWMNG